MGGNGVPGCLDGHLGGQIAPTGGQGITTGVLSLLSAFTWIERQPLEESQKLTRMYNDSRAALCKAHEGRFVALASLPLTDNEPWVEMRPGTLWMFRDGEVVAQTDTLPSPVQSMSDMASG